MICFIKTVRLTIVFLVIVIGMLFTPITYANPIPVPTLILEKEFIEISIEKVNETTLLVNVNGTYPFKNVEFEKVTMYFPIPPHVNRDSIIVTLNNKPLKWIIVDEGYIETSKGLRKFRYETVEGVYPLLSWNITDLPKSFIINVRYSYYIHLKNGEYHILYAMGTGRYNLYYSKKCTAYVKLRLSKLTGHILNVILTPPLTYPGKTIFKSVINGEEEEYTIIEESRLFQGLKRDLLLIIGEPVKNEKWITSKPYSTDMKTTTIKKDNSLKLNITLIMVFRHGGFKVDWGRIEREENNINIYTYVWEWTGPAIQVLTTKKHTYSINDVTPGFYVITVYVNNEPMKSIKVTINDTINHSHTKFTTRTSTTTVTYTTVKFITKETTMTITKTEREGINTIEGISLLPLPLMVLLALLIILFIRRIKLSA